MPSTSTPEASAGSRRPGRPRSPSRRCSRRMARGSPIPVPPGWPRKVNSPSRSAVRTEPEPAWPSPSREARPSRVGARIHRASWCGTGTRCLRTWIAWTSPRDGRRASSRFSPRTPSESRGSRASTSHRTPGPTSTTSLASSPCSISSKGSSDARRSSVMTLSAGTRLGPYEILAPLGAGGMGEVYRAKDTKLGREVAIKVLPEQFFEEKESIARFEREAKSLAAVNHPHIAALYSFDEVLGRHVLVMELAEGQTLSERLLKGPLAPDQLLRTAIEIASALDAAHRAGIVHRDLKPGNVMLTKSGTKLLDFGLAKAAAPLVQPSDLTSQPTELPKNLTQKGTILGTLQYMAPEQLEGKEADARSDIFAFGALLYEMATGLRSEEPGIADHGDHVSGPAGDFERAADVASRARPGGQNLPGKGS